MLSEHLTRTEIGCKNRRNADVSSNCQHINFVQSRDPSSTRLRKKKIFIQVIHNLLEKKRIPMGSKLPFNIIFVDIFFTSELITSH